MSDIPAPDVEQLSRLLTNRFGTSVRDVRPLGAGKWSRAFAFDTDARRLVIRFGDYDEDFIKDRVAASWQQPGLPVPTFLDLGEAFGTFYAITERADGQFLDHLSHKDVADTLPSVFRLLDTLRQIPAAKTATGFGGWNRDGVGEHTSWKEMLLTVETTRPPIDGWQLQLKKWPGCQQAFDEGFERLHHLVDLVPSRRDVIHRDLVNRNVLVKDAEITSVFDWGCSLYGDHLYDVAWLTFCSAYTTGFDRLEFRRLARQHYVRRGIDPVDFDQRVECYELHIGLAALPYRAFTGDEAGAQFLEALIRDVLRS